MQYLSKSYISGMHLLSFQSLQNISIFFTTLYNIKCLVNIKIIKVYEKIILWNYFWPLTVIEKLRKLPAKNTGKHIKPYLKGNTPCILNLRLLIYIIHIIIFFFFLKILFYTLDIFK